MTPIPDSLRPLLERALEEMEADWHRIDEEFGPVEGGLDGAISRGEAGVIPELRALLSQPAEQLPPLIQCLRENGQQIAERAFDAQEAKYPQPQPSAAQVPEGYTLERDLMGAMHIKWGDFDFIQIQYQWPYTDNASTRRLAERIVELLSAPAHPAPRNEQAGEVQRLREALERIADTDPDEGTSWFHDVANAALAQTSGGDTP